METAAAIKFFGSQYKLAAALGIKQGSVGKWKKYPPELRQLQLERLCGGTLKAEENILPRRRTVKNINK